MAKPNYSFEKRQRELAKKRKKEDKAVRKAHPGPNDAAEGGETPGPAPDGTPAGDIPAPPPGGSAQQP